MLSNRQATSFAIAGTVLAVTIIVLALLYHCRWLKLYRKKLATRGVPLVNRPDSAQRSRPASEANESAINHEPADQIKAVHSSILDSVVLAMTSSSLLIPVSETMSPTGSAIGVDKAGTLGRDEEQGFAPDESDTASDAAEVAWKGQVKPDMQPPVKNLASATTMVTSQQPLTCDDSACSCLAPFPLGPEAATDVDCMTSSDDLPTTSLVPEHEQLAVDRVQPSNDCIDEMHKNRDLVGIKKQETTPSAAKDGYGLTMLPHIEGQSSRNYDNVKGSTKATLQSADDADISMSEMPAIDASRIGIAPLSL